MPEFSIIIPQYGQSELTLTAVDSLLHTQTGSLEILVVDDGSPFSDIACLQSQFRSHVSLIRQSRRQGVTAAWNLGARLATGATLVFLNNDTVSTGPWLETLAAPLAKETILLTAPESRNERQLSGPLRQVLKGWCMAIRKETFARVGMFDERFRLYFSDTDLQLRLRGLSAEALLRCPALPLQHQGRCSTQHLLSRRTEWRQDRDRFRQKWGL